MLTSLVEKRDTAGDVAKLKEALSKLPNGQGGLLGGLLGGKIRVKACPLLNAQVFPLSALFLVPSSATFPLLAVSVFVMFRSMVSTSHLLLRHHLLTRIVDLDDILGQLQEVVDGELANI